MREAGAASCRGTEARPCLCAHPPGLGPARGRASWMRSCGRGSAFAPQQRADRDSPETVPASRAAPTARPGLGARGSDRLPRTAQPRPVLWPSTACPATPPRAPRLPPRLCRPLPWCPNHVPPPDQTETPEAWAPTPALLATVQVSWAGRSLPEPRLCGDERGTARACGVQCSQDNLSGSSKECPARGRCWKNGQA